MRTVVAVCIGAFGLLHVSCVSRQTANPLGVPKEGITFNLPQRDATLLPGGAENLFIRLGDITRGQVLVEVAAARANEEALTHFRSVLSPLLMKERDSRTFTYDGGEYRLTVVKLVNELFGTDMATLKLELAKAPREGEKDAEPKAPASKPGLPKA